LVKVRETKQKEEGKKEKLRVLKFLEVKIKSAAGLA